MAYTTINKSTDYFNTVTYSGSNSSQSVTGVGFQPDWVWMKQRGGTTDHKLADAVRGYNKNITSNSTAAETTHTYFTSFDSDGFTLDGNVSDYNKSGLTYVSWNWKANGQGSSNTDGAVNTTYTSANTTSGFSISLVSNLNSNTFGHGLGVEPDVIFNKRTDDVANWRIYYKGITSGNSLFLNSTSGSSSEGSRISSADATTVTVTGSGHGGTAGTGTAVFYCFANKTGFSSSGTYQGNGNADGAFIYTGFKPAWILNKRVDSTGNWMLIDNKRLGYNPAQRDLRPNLTNAEGSDETFDILSNGFKVRTTSGDFGGGSGAVYIYMAFADKPLVGSNNVPAVAR